MTSSLANVVLVAAAFAPSSFVPSAARFGGDSGKRSGATSNKKSIAFSALGASSSSSSSSSTSKRKNGGGVYRRCDGTIKRSSVCFSAARGGGGGGSGGRRNALSNEQPSTSGREDDGSTSSSAAEAKEERRRETTFPPDHKVFRAKKTMRVPVKERKEALRKKASIEHWLKDPNESLGVVFDRNERLSEDKWKVFVASKKKIAFWELSPAFTLEILPNETEFGKQAFRGFDLMLCADEDAEECGWVNDVSVFANIFCQLRVDRDDEEEVKEDYDEDDDDDDNKTDDKYVTPIVVADVDVTIAALLPSFVNAIPGFTNIGEASIAASIDFARDGAARRVQMAYDSWVEKKIGSSSSSTS
jgi:hypothetical protein